MVVFRDHISWHAPPRNVRKLQRQMMPSAGIYRDHTPCMLPLEVDTFENCDFKWCPILASRYQISAHALLRNV